MFTYDESNNFVNDIFGFQPTQYDGEPVVIDLTDPDIADAMEYLSLNGTENVDETEIHIVSDDDDDDSDSEASTVAMEEEEDSDLEDDEDDEDNEDNEDDSQSVQSMESLEEDDEEFENQVFITPIHYTQHYNEEILNSPPPIPRRHFGNGTIAAGNLQPINLLTHMNEVANHNPAPTPTPARPLTFRHMHPRHMPPPPPRHFLH